MKKYIIFIIITLLSSSRALSSENYRLLDIDDVLKMEGVKNITFTPNGEKVIFEKMPPYDQIGDYSSHSYTALKRTKLYIFDKNNPDKPRLLFPQNDKSGYFLSSGPNSGFNKDGSYIIVYKLSRINIELGIFNLTSNTVKWLSIEPLMDRNLSTHPLWVQKDSFIISAFPTGEQSSPILKPIRAKESLLNDWENAWSGQTVTAHTQVSNSVGGEINENLAKEFRNGSLILVNATNGNTRKLSDGLYGSLRLSPNGRYLAALRQGGELLLDPDYPIMAMPLTKYRLQPVVFDIEKQYAKSIICNDCDAFTTRVEWSRDSKNLVFFIRSYDNFWHKGKFLKYNIAEKSYKYLNHFGLDLAPTSSNRYIAGPDRPSWIGGRLAVFARPILNISNKSNNEINNDYRPNTYHISGSIGEEKDLITGRPDWYLLSEIGDHINLTESFKDFSFELLGEEEDAIIIFADGNVWRIKSNGEKENLTKHIDKKISSIPGDKNRIISSVSQDINKEILLEEFSEADVWVSSFDYSSGDLKRLFNKKNIQNKLEDVSFVSKSAVIRENQGYLTTFSVLDLESRQKTEILTINKHLDYIKRFPIKEIKYFYENKENKRELKSCMILPPDWEPGKRYPLIAIDYPKARGNCYPIVNTDRIYVNMTPLSSQGYILLHVDHAVDLLSSNDRSLPFANLTDMALTAVDAAIEQGYADPERIGLYGFSLGGIGSLWMLTQTNRFKAAVSSNGYANFARMYGTTSLLFAVTGPLVSYDKMGFFEMPSYELYLGGAKPWEDPSRYTKSSPFFSVHKISTPLLLMHSDLDGHDLGGYRQMFSALRRLRKEASYIEYRGEGHAPSSPANIRHRFNSISDWYNKHLK